MSTVIITDQKFLRQLCTPTTVKEVEELQLVRRLIAANKTAWTDGAGLAAIQIGLPIRFAWYKLGNIEGVLLNPEITKGFGVSVEKEGCLSIPGSYVDVERFLSIEYVSNGKRKKANGFLARIIQHEIDHMNGILNIDKVRSKSLGI